MIPQPSYTNHLAGGAEGTEVGGAMERRCAKDGSGGTMAKGEGDGEDAEPPFFACETRSILRKSARMPAHLQRRSANARCDHVRGEKQLSGS